MPSRKVSAHESVSSRSRAFQAGRTWLNGLISRPIHALKVRKDDVRPSSGRRQAERGRGMGAPPALLSALGAHAVRTSEISGNVYLLRLYVLHAMYIEDKRPFPPHTGGCCT